MTQPRRPRGTMKDPVVPGWKIERASKLRIESMARNANVSAAVMLELLAEHVELTNQGIPVWMPEQNRDGELPINSA